MITLSVYRPPSATPATFPAFQSRTQAKLEIANGYFPLKRNDALVLALYDDVIEYGIALGGNKVAWFKGWMPTVYRVEEDMEERPARSTLGLAWNMLYLNNDSWFITMAPTIHVEMPKIKFQLFCLEVISLYRHLVSEEVLKITSKMVSWSMAENHDETNYINIYRKFRDACALYKGPKTNQDQEYLSLCATFSDQNVYGYRYSQMLGFAMDSNLLSQNLGLNQDETIRRIANIFRSVVSLPEYIQYIRDYYAK